MTLGGQISGVDHALEELKALITHVVGVESNFPSSHEIPISAQYSPSAKDNFVDLPILIQGYLYYFDVAPGTGRPDVKFSIPIRRYGGGDLKVAKGISRWMESRGRGHFVEKYMRVLEGLAKH